MCLWQVLRFVPIAWTKVPRFHKCKRRGTSRGKKSWTIYAGHQGQGGRGKRSCLRIDIKQEEVKGPII